MDGIVSKREQIPTGEAVITSVRGKVFEAELLGFNVRIMPAFHPAAAIYDVKFKDYLEEEFRVLKNELERGKGSERP